MLCALGFLPALAAQPLAYATSEHEVSVVDVGSQHRLTGISLDGLASEISVTADGRRLYVGLYYGTSVAVVDVETQAARYIEFGTYTDGNVRLSPDETKLYVEITGRSNRD